MMTIPILDLLAGGDAVEQATGFFVSLGEKIKNYLPTLLIALIVFLIGLLLARLINKLMDRTMRRSRIDATASGFGRSLVRILIYTLLIIICLSILGVPTASIITVIGAAGVAIGLALQNSLSNLAGGFLILIAKPFQVGDYIIVGSEEGVVDSVSILYTKLVSRDNRSIYLPNGIVSAGQLINLSQRGMLKISAPVSVSYGTDLSQARNTLLAALAEQEMFLKDPAPTVTVKELADSGVILSVNVWVKKEDYFLAPPRVLECAKNALDAASIEIPFPQIVVHETEQTASPAEI